MRVQGQCACFSQSPLNEVPGHGVPDGFGDNEADSTRLRGPDRGRI